jgi:plastocyanin
MPQSFGRFYLIIIASFFCAFALPSATLAADSSVAIQFKDHQFNPQTLIVAAGQPLSLKVVNASKETIEFESFKLNREVAMTPGETVTVRLPALSPGSYDFYDDFHQDVPEGAIVAK